MLLKLVDHQQNVKLFHILRFEAKNGQLNIIEENMGYVQDDLDKDVIIMEEYSRISVYDVGTLVYDFAYIKDLHVKVIDGKMENCLVKKD